MAVEKGSAGKSTRNLADMRYSKRVIITLIGIAAVALLLILLPNLKGLGLAGLVGIVIVFLALKLIMNITDNETDHYEKLERRAAKGARAEEKIGDILRQLPEGYYIYHDIVSPHGNIDHVVLNNESQIFLIETKSHNGEVTYDGTSPLINHKIPEKDFIRQILNNTYWLCDEIKRQTDANVFIKPVIVFTNAFVKIPDSVKNISIINKKFLSKVLLKPSGSSDNIIKNLKADTLSSVLEGLQSRSESKLF